MDVDFTAWHRPLLSLWMMWIISWTRWSGNLSTYKRKVYCRIHFIYIGMLWFMMCNYRWSSWASIGCNILFITLDELPGEWLGLSLAKSSCNWLKHELDLYLRVLNKSSYITKRVKVCIHLGIHDKYSCIYLCLITSQFALPDAAICSGDWAPHDGRAAMFDEAMQWSLVPS